MAFCENEEGAVFTLGYEMPIDKSFFFIKYGISSITRII